METRKLYGLSIMTSGVLMGETVYLAIAMFDRHGGMVGRDDERAFVMNSVVFTNGSDWAPRKWVVHIASGAPYPRNEVVRLAEHQAAYALAQAMRDLNSERKTSGYAEHEIALAKCADRKGA